MIKADLISNLQFNLWNISYITSHPFFMGALELTNDQLPTSVASQFSWLERRTGIARSRVQTPSKFCLFQVSLRNRLNCVYNYRNDDHSWLNFKSAVQYMKHFIITSNETLWITTIHATLTESEYLKFRDEFFLSWFITQTQSFQGGFIMVTGLSGV